MQTIVLIPITPLPALTRTDITTFKPAVDTYFGQQLPTFTVDINTLALQIQQLAQWASDYAKASSDSADASALSAGAAAASEQRVEQMVVVAEAAIAASPVPPFVSGQAVAVGDMRYSPISFETYRAMTAGVRTVDPSNDGDNWYLLGHAQAQQAALLWAFIFRRR